MKRKTFVFRVEWGNALNCLPADICKEVVVAMCAYNAGEALPEMKSLSRAMFESFRPFFDDMNEKFERMQEQRKEAGIKSAKARAVQRALTSVDFRSTKTNENERALTSVESRSVSMSMSMCSSNEELKKEKDKSFSKKSLGVLRIALSEDEYSKLVEQFGETAVKEQIAIADDWTLANGKTYKDYAAFMRNWLKRNAAKGRLRASSQSNKPATPNLDKSTEDLIARGLIRNDNKCQ